ncbi:MAG: hypothetical protein HOG70_00510, partial [Elusimicrobiaceae bacterium]|nr:hypothetical protein [Elusimicrobiaceae bacterium]
MTKKIVIIAIAMLSFLIGKTNLFAETNIEDKVTSIVSQETGVCEKYYGSEYFAKKEKENWLPMLYTDSKCTEEFNEVELNLYDNQIKDLTPLAGLINLEKLILNYNQIEDLTPLAGLTNLEKLFSSNNQIKDLTPLDGLINLEKLILNYNQIEDLTPLAGLTNL